MSKDKLIELSEIEAYFGDSELNILEPKLVRNNESKPAKNNFIDYLDLICFRMKVLITKIKGELRMKKRNYLKKLIIQNRLFLIMLSIMMIIIVGLF